MQKEKLRAAVNGVYGYNAISRIVLTQTAATGFAEGQAEFIAAPKAQLATSIPPEVVALAERDAKAVQDTGLRRALETLAKNVHLKNNMKKGS
jgi:hypothetical protein